MTPRKPANPDAITHAEGAQILGVKQGTIRRLIRDGALHRVPGQHPSLSKAEVEEQARNPRQSEWINGTEAAKILNVSTTRAWQLALGDLIPWEYSVTGRRHYRRSQIEVISRARQINWHPIDE